jgi:outer membrane protein TolC
MTIGNLSKPALPVLSLSLEELLAMAKNSRPELKEDEANLRKERHAKALANLENAPDFSIGFQYIEIGNGMTTDPEDGRDAWMIPLKVTIPLWQNRIGSAIAEANRNLKAGEARLSNSENMTVFEVKDAYFRYTSSKNLVDLYENALLPQVELAFASDKAGYEAGRTDILNLLDSERVFLNTKIAYFEAYAQLLKDYASLEKAIGINLFPKE